MKSLNKYLGLAVMAVVLLTSCNKGVERDLEEAKLNGEKEISKKEVFTGFVSPYGQIDDDESDFRASLLRKGYPVPIMDVTKAELKEGKTKAHWGVMGDNVNCQIVNTLNPNNVLEKKAGAVTETSLYVEEGKGANKNKFTFYCPVSKQLGTPASPYSEKWAYFAFGGENIDNRYIDFSGDTAPNKRVIGITNSNEDIFRKDIERQIPLMTDVMSFKKLLGKEKEEVTLEPRGVLLSLLFVNKMNRKFKLKRIQFYQDNLVFFEGKFDMQKAPEHSENEGFHTSKYSSNMKANFIGKTEQCTYHIYGWESSWWLGWTTSLKEGCDIPKISSSVGDKVAYAKQNAPLFHIWGMPRIGSGKKELYFKIFVELGGSKHEERAIYRPKLGDDVDLEEGKVYPVIIEVNEVDFEL